MICEWTVYYVFLISTPTIYTNSIPVLIANNERTPVWIISDEERKAPVWIVSKEDVKNTSKVPRLNKE